MNFIKEVVSSFVQGFKEGREEAKFEHYIGMKEQEIEAMVASSMARIREKSIPFHVEGGKVKGGIKK